MIAGPAFAAPNSSLQPAASPSSPSITVIAGTGKLGFSGDGGPAVNAQLALPTGVAEDPTGTLYIADTANNRIRKVVDPTTINSDDISTIAGNGTGGYAGDGGPATSAELRAPTGIAVDSAGNVFVADTGNNVVREISAGGTIQTIAGTGKCTTAKPTKTAPALTVSLCAPTGVAVNSAGDVFISNTGQNDVWELLPNGNLADYAGNSDNGLKGNGGPATNAELTAPTALAVDALGNLYIADTGNSEIREVSTSGTITDFAGDGKFGFSGDGGAATSAKLAGPTGLGVDPSGNVYIADTVNDRVRIVSGGIINTYAGNGKLGNTGNGGPATSAELALPAGEIAADGSAVYFADTGNSQVKGVFVGPPPVLPETAKIILLPLSAVLIGGAGYYVLRRRRRSAAARLA